MKTEYNMRMTSFEKLGYDYMFSNNTYVTYYKHDQVIGREELTLDMWQIIRYFEKHNRDIKIKHILK